MKHIIRLLLDILLIATCTIYLTGLKVSEMEAAQSEAIAKAVNIAEDQAALKQFMQEIERFQNLMRTVEIMKIKAAYINSITEGAEK